MFPADSSRAGVDEWTEKGWLLKGTKCSVRRIDRYYMIDGMNSEHALPALP
jgi:hypothetical protein